MEPKEIIRKAQVGDKVHIRKGGPNHLGNEWLKVLAIYETDLYLVETNGYYLSNGKAVGYPIGDFNYHDLDSPGCKGRDNVIELQKSGSTVEALWMSMINIDDIDQDSDALAYQGKPRPQAFQPKPSGEKSEQLRKDIGFFFKDLAEPWESPKKNGFEFL